MEILYHKQKLRTSAKIWFSKVHLILCVCNFSCLFYETDVHISKERKQNVLLMHTITFFKYTIMFKNDLRAMHYKNSLWYEDMTTLIFSILCTKKVCVVNNSMYYIEQTSDYNEILHQITQTPRITDS